MINADYEVEPRLNGELWVRIAKNLEAKRDLLLSLVLGDDSFEYA